MLFEVLTLFPEYYEVFFNIGLMKKACLSGVVQKNIINIREGGEGNTLRVDDTPYGGMPGMLLKYEVMHRVYQKTSGCHTILLSPRGKVLTQQRVVDLAQKKSLVLVCGHYEGIDQRFIRHYVDEELSIGDYVVCGGEMPSLVLMEAISRQLEKFMGHTASKSDESFAEYCLLEYDQYTRPSVLNKRKQWKKKKKMLQ